MPVLKSVTVAGHEILLRSVDGRTWFEKPRDLIHYRRRRAKQREWLRKQWDLIPMRDIELPDDTFPCGAKV